jgi:hypothetical protein
VVAAIVPRPEAAGRAETMEASDAATSEEAA